MGSNVRIPCPAMGGSSSPPGGPQKKDRNRNRIVACLFPCSIIEMNESGLFMDKKPGGLAGGPCMEVPGGKVGGLRRGMIPPDDALLKKPLRIVMEEIDCSKLDFSQCPKCPPTPKVCSPSKPSSHITAAPCVTQTKPAGVLKTNKICPQCPPQLLQKGHNNHPKASPQPDCSPTRPTNSSPCPEQGRESKSPDKQSKKKSPEKNPNGLEDATNSVLEMTLDQTGNLINQCAPKGSPTILKVEKLDEAGATETVIKITFCSGKSQPLDAASSGQKKYSPPVSAPAKPTGQPAPQSTRSSPVRDKSPSKQSSANTKSLASEESQESDDRIANQRNESVRSEEEEEEVEAEVEEEYEDQNSPDRRVAIALVEPSTPKPHAECLRKVDQKDETPQSQSPCSKESSLVYQPQPLDDLSTPLPLPRPIWLPPSMVRSASPPCHDRDTSQLTYNSLSNKDEETYESKPHKECEDELAVKETQDKQVVVKTNELDERKTEICLLKPIRKRSWRSTALSKTIRGTKDVSMAITYSPLDGPADSLQPLISMKSAESLIRQLESLPLPSKTWGLRADEVEAIATSSSSEVTKLSSPRLNKRNTQLEKKIRSPTRAVIRRSPPRDSNTLVRKNDITPKAKPKGPMQFFIGQSTNASSVTRTALRKRNMRVICASSLKREIRPSSAKKMFKETAV